MVWGFSFVLVALSLKAFQPLFVVWCRLLMGALVMFCVCLLLRVELDLSLKFWSNVFVLSLTGNLLPFTLIANAERVISSSEAGILMGFMPIATVLFSHWLLPNERLTWRRSIGVLLGILGVIILAGDGVYEFRKSENLHARLAVLIAALSYAINGIYAKRIPGAHPIFLAFGTLFLGALLLLPAALSQQSSVKLLQLAPEATLALFGLGVFATGLASWAYFVVVIQRGPAFLSVINYLIPCLAFFAGIVVLSEPWGWGHLAALICIAIGVWMIQMPERAN